MNINTHTPNVTIEEMGESLTGFEEIAIVTHFGKTLSQLLEQHATMGLRALIFTDVHRRGETNVQESKAAAMTLPLRDVMAYFLEEEEEDDVDLDDLEGAGGKDSAPAA